MVFEIAVHTTFTTYSHSTVVTGCLLILVSLVGGRYVKSVKKSNTYNNGPSFTLKIKCFIALALLLPKDVVDIFELLPDEVIPAEFITYFEGAYICV